MRLLDHVRRKRRGDDPKVGAGAPLRQPDPRRRAHAAPDGPKVVGQGPRAAGPSRARRYGPTAATGAAGARRARRCTTSDRSATFLKLSNAIGVKWSNDRASPAGRGQ